MAANNGLIPSKSVFLANGLQGMLVVIGTTHGGLGAVRERLGVSGMKHCGGCDQVLGVDQFRLRKTEGKGTFRNNTCRRCDGNSSLKYRATWVGRAAEMHRRARERAKKLGREYDLTKEWVFERLVSFNFKCEVTGIDLVADTRGHGTGFRNRFGASLDRIDSTRGYTKDNVRIVSNRANIALGDLTDAQFEIFAAGFLRVRGWGLTPPVAP